MWKWVPGYWRENFRRSLLEWEGREVLIGLLIVILTALGYGAYANDPHAVKFWAVVAIVYVVFLLCVQSPWQMWNAAQLEIVGYKERLRPNLSFVFEPDTPPYLHHFGLIESGRVSKKIRICRVGIRNDSAAVIPGVRVVIESFEYWQDGAKVQPTVDSPALVEHALNVMGIDKKHGRIDLVPGDRPTAYIDIAEQIHHEGQSFPERWMSPCYATGHRTPMSIERKSHWIIGLRLEGGNTYIRQRFTIDGSGLSGRLVLKPHGLGR